MNISIAGKGVHRREIPGIEKLRSLPSEWYAFPNLEIIRSGAMPRQIDIVIVLDDRILIVDLKDWHGKITSDLERWFQNDRIVDTSPVKKILDNARILKGELENYLAKREGRSFNRRDVPLVEGCVVLTNRCDVRDLPEFEKLRVFQIDDFCRFIKDGRERGRRLAEPPWVDRLSPLTAPDSKWRPLLAAFFGAGGGYFRPLKKRYGDYTVTSDITYKHPKDLYAEYDAEEVGASRSWGLLRLWDFSKAAPRYASPEGREEIAGREQGVLGYLIDRQPELETVVVRPKVADPEKGIHYWEVFERRRQLKRLGEFISQRREELSPPTRLDLARTLLSHVAAMHRLGAAHLDLGSHSVWLELPSTVRLSHFVAASYPELKSLGDRRYEFLAGNLPLPEDVLGGTVDHFRKDTFLLACAVHMLVFLQSPQPMTPGDPPDWNPSVDAFGQFQELHEWFQKGLDHAATERFAHAQEMLDAFIEASTHDRTAAALERLQRFRKWKSLLEVMRVYPVTHTISETDRVLVWRSSGTDREYLIKAWRRSCWDDDRQEANRLARFCETAEDYALAAPAGTVPIVAVGYLGDHIVLVQEFVDAPNLAEGLSAVSTWGVESTLLFAHSLAVIVRALHARGWSHGDLKPANILIKPVGDRREPALIDLLELVPASEGEVKTSAYSPTQGVGSQERDRYAVLAITAELMGGIQAPTLTAQAIARAIALCREQHPVLSTLEPLVEALDAALAPPRAASPEPVLVRAIGAVSGAVVPDEGRYHVGIPKAGTVTVTGAAEELTVRWDRDGHVGQIRRRAIQQGRVAAAERKAIASLPAEIVVEGGSVNDYAALEELLKTAVLESTPAQAPSTTATAGSGLGSVAQDIAELDEDGPPGLYEEVAPEVVVDVPALWRTLIDVELEQFTEGVADGDSAYLRDKRRHFVPFQGRKGTLDFSKGDRVAVEVPSKTRGWVQVGFLDLDLSRIDMIAVDAAGFRGADGAPLCSAGTEIRFRSLMETDSRVRRDAATKRVLARQSVVPDLLEYLDPASRASRRRADGAPDAETLKVKYGLNESQAAAFVNLWSSRPVSLLQGPPGTGKTKFIAAVVHHLLSTGQVKNVLLASQSHEAVNNAAEGVLRLFRSEGKEPSLVRVGQEGSISDLLKPYHSGNVETRYREQFRAGLKQRFQVVGRHLGLPDEFIDDFFFMESTLWPVFRQVQELAADPTTDDAVERSERVIRLLDTLDRLGAQVAGGRLKSLQWSDADAYSDAIDQLRDLAGVLNADHVRRMRTVATLARDWMGSVSSRRRSFEEFLANTRQIVCGTCVGLGRAALGLAAAQFDLVVVDEAARCTPSELAVPIQSGRWVLMVGDHYQLEPFHVPEVLREVRSRLGVSEAAVTKSDFERAFGGAYGRSVGTTLTTQYRMLPTIGRMVSEVFYGGRLEHGRESAKIPPECLPELLKDELLWIKTDDLGEQAYQVKSSTGTSLHNPVEADAIVDVVLALDNHEPFIAWLESQQEGEKAIGIICTYADQRELIRRRLNAAGVSGRLLAACKIDTVDSYQGKENAIVILSLVRNNNLGRSTAGERTIAQGYMARGNRINVAVSRAMDRLVIVGAADRWPETSPMARVSASVRTLAVEGTARIVDASALARDRDGERVRHLKRSTKAHQRNVRNPQP